MAEASLRALGDAGGLRLGRLQGRLPVRRLHAGRDGADRGPGGREQVQLLRLREFHQREHHAVRSATNSACT